MSRIFDKTPKASMWGHVRYSGTAVQFTSVNCHMRYNMEVRQARALVVVW